MSSSTKIEHHRPFFWGVGPVGGRVSLRVFLGRFSFKIQAIINPRPPCRVRSDRKCESVVCHACRRVWLRTQSRRVVDRDKGDVSSERDHLPRESDQAVHGRQMLVGHSI